VIATIAARTRAKTERGLEVISATWWLEFVGLAAGFAGALLVTLTQRPGESGSGFERRGGTVAEFIVLEYPKLWKLGLWLLSAGFLLQGISLICRGGAR